MSQQEYWHAGSRSSYLTALAFVRSHAEHHGRFPSHPMHDARTPMRLPPSAIPDLRFEPTYLAKLATAGPGWQSVLWVTVRDQVISPLIQGALWCVVCVPLARRDLTTIFHLQGCRIRVHTTLGTISFWMAVFASRPAASEGRQCCSLAAPVGPFALSRFKVGKLGKNSMTGCRHL